ncbi:MAG: putative rane protein insertion efficiency factor [Actinomycetota bacterium]
MLMLTKLLSTPIIYIIQAYRKFISPLTPPSCRLHPSCSTYALKAVQTHGPIKGVLLSVWRVLRCNPFTKGGVDPVPAKGSWRAAVDLSGNPRELTKVGSK